MHTEISRTFVITIKGNLPPEEGKRLADKIKNVVSSDGRGYAVGLHVVTGADKIYIGSRPDKRARLEAIQSLPESMTTTEVAAKLGLTERQVYRYRAMLRALAGDAEVD